MGNWIALGGVGAVWLGWLALHAANPAPTLIGTVLGIGAAWTVTRWQDRRKGARDDA